MTIIIDLQTKKDFTATESSLADFILEHLEEVPKWSISALSQQSHSSSSSISRLCQKLGLSGYKEFRVKLMSEVEKQHFQKNAIDFSYPFSLIESPGTIMSNLAKISKEAIDICYASIEQEKISELARQLRAARRIYLLAVGDSYLQVLSFANMLVKLGIHAIIVNQFHDSIATIYHAGEDDLALFLTYSGNLMTIYKKELSILKQRRVKTVLISSSTNSEKSDITITIPAEENIIEKTGGFYSQLAIQFIFHSLYSLIYASNFLHHQRLKNDIERLSKR